MIPGCVQANLTKIDYHHTYPWHSVDLRVYFRTAEEAGRFVDSMREILVDKENEKDAK